ncbi:hypothetical protein A2U01_0102157, partial [Trifolium medium]|nr:hypothetical protein [Trifolium medium]
MLMAICFGSCPPVASFSSSTALASRCSGRGLSFPWTNRL